MKRRSPIVPVLARLTLGAVFVVLGGVKVLDPVSFLKLVRAFHVVQQPPLLNAVAALLPWFEVFCGVLLLAGIKRRATALLAFVTLAAFTALIAVRAWQEATGPASFWEVRFDCGCGTGEILAWAKLLENAALMFVAGVVLRANPETPENRPLSPVEDRSA